MALISIAHAPSTPEVIACTCSSIEESHNLENTTSIFTEHFSNASDKSAVSRGVYV